MSKEKENGKADVKISRFFANFNQLDMYDSPLPGFNLKG